MYQVGTKKKPWMIVSLLLSVVCFLAGGKAFATTVPTFQAESPLVVTYPARIGQDSNDNIYVADARDSAVVVFDKYNRKINRITSVQRPYAVAAGPYGDIFVASVLGGVYRLGAGGDATNIIADGSVGFPADMAIDSAGYFYIVDSKANEVKVFTAAGDFVRTFGGDGGTWYPTAVALGSDSLNGEELIFVGYSVEWIDANNTSMIMAYDINGTVVRSFGVPHLDANTPAPEAIKRVTGLTLDGKGRVYVADLYAHRVTVFDDQGVHLTVLPSGVLPVAVFYGSFDRFFISTGVGQVSVFSVDGAGLPNSVPSAPLVVSPIGGSAVTTATPALVAGNSSDTDGDALVYEFVVAADAAMTNVIWSINDVPEGADGQTSVVVDVALQEDSLYYWTARSFDGTEYSSASLATSFFVNTVNSAPFFGPDATSEGGFYVLPGFSETLSADASDSDGDLLQINWQVDGLDVGQEDSYEFVATVENMGVHTVEVQVSDQEFSLSRQWQVTVGRQNTAPTAPSANTPGGGEDVTSLMPELSINNSTDAEGDGLVYNFDVSVDSNFSGIVASMSGVAQGDPVTQVAVNVELSENTLYYWRAEACEVPNADDYVEQYYCSAYSATAEFFVNVSNDAPTPPGISSPENGTEVTTLNPTLVVINSMDYDQGAGLTYDFQLSSEGSFAAPLAAESGVAQGENGNTEWTVPVDVVLDDNTTYYWQSRACDEYGECSGWSTGWFFMNTANDVPTAPTLLSPANGSESVPQPELVVNNSTDVDLDDLVYHFEVDSAATFDSAAKQVSQAVSEGSGETSWTVPVVLEENKIYYWRVKANDGAADSAWMTMSTFFVNTSNDAPTVPVLMSPLNGVAVNTDTPELTIYESTDADGDALVYLYQVSSDEAFADIVDEGQNSGLSWTVEWALEEDAQYYWRASAVDEHGTGSGWSASASFRVNMANDPPSAPMLSWQEFNEGDTIVVEIGNSTDVEGDVLTYSGEVYSDRNLKNLVAEVDGLPEGYPMTSWEVGILDKDSYYVRVRAHDGETYGSWSGTRILRVYGANKKIDSQTDDASRLQKPYGDKRF